MALPESFIDELIRRNDIADVASEYTALSDRGGRKFGLCPFHSEKTASFSVSPDRQLYYCFGCGKGGGVINFIMEIENLEYIDAVRHLARRAGLEIPEEEDRREYYHRRARLLELSADAARYYHSLLWADGGERARSYLEDRRLSRRTITRFGLGWSADSWDGLIRAMTEKGYTKSELLDAGLAVSGKNGGIYDRFRGRVIFPIIDVRGDVIGFGGRVLDDSTPKYLNSPESTIFNKSRNLFGLNLAKRSKQGRIILTEGYMDTIALHQAGFDCAVASLGTSLTSEHASLVAKYTKEVVLAYDGDEAGQNAAQRAIGLFRPVDVSLKVLRMRDAKDPDEFIKKYGSEAFRKLLEGSENSIEYRLMSIRAKYDLEDDGQRVGFMKEAVELTAGLGSAVEREVYGGRAADIAKVSAQAFLSEVERSRKSALRREKKKQERENLSPARSAQPLVRSLRYSNVRSAVAEEGVIRLVAQEPSLFEHCGGLSGDRFSSELLGKVFEQLRRRWEEGLSPGLGALEGSFSAEEMAHLSGLMQDAGAPAGAEAALRDYTDTICTEYAKQNALDGRDALIELRDRYKAKKGYGG